MKRDGSHALAHAAIYFVARGLPGIIAFVAIPLFTHLLDPASYGRYALVIATTGLVNALFYQWLRLALVRYVPAYRNDPVRLKSTLLTVALLLNVLAGVAAGVMYFIPSMHEWRPALLPGWCVLAVMAVFDIFCELMRASIKPWHYMVLQLSRSIVSVGLGALLIVLHVGWVGPVIGLAVGMLIPVVWAYRRDWTDARLLIDRKTLLVVAQYGIPISVTVALATVISSSDRFIIAWMRGDYDAGLYSVAVDLTSQTLTLLMIIVNMAMFPLAVRAYEEHGAEAASRQMKHNASLLMAVGIPAAIGLIILAPGISNAFLDEKYRGAAALIIPLVALGTFLAGYKAYQLDAAFQFAHKTIHQVWIVLIAAAVNVALNLVLIRPMGIQGSALASVIAYLVSMVLTAWIGRRHFVLPFPFAAFGQVMFAGAAMALVLYPFRDHVSRPAVAVQIAAGAVVYAAGLIAFDFLEIRSSLVARFRTPAREVVSMEGTAS